jgi:hypothetical protein
LIHVSQREQRRAEKKRKNGKEQRKEKKKKDSMMVNILINFIYYKISKKIIANGQTLTFQ